MPARACCTCLAAAHAVNGCWGSLVIHNYIIQAGSCFLTELLLFKVKLLLFLCVCACAIGGGR